MFSDYELYDAQMQSNYKNFSNLDGYVYYDDEPEPKLEDILKKCKTDNETELQIEREDIDTIPACIKEFDHLKTLSIERISKLERITNIPTNLVCLRIKKTGITIVDGSIFPNCLEEIDLGDNKLKVVFGLKEGIKKLLLNDNILESITNIPSTVEILKVSDNDPLDELPELSNNLKYLSIEATKIDSFEKFPDSIEELISNQCNLGHIKKLPKNIKIWKSLSSHIMKIDCEIPFGIIELDLWNNMLQEVPDLPESLETVDLSKNILIKIPVFGMTMKEISLKDNQVLSTKFIDDLRKLDSEYHFTRINFDDDIDEENSRVRFFNRYKPEPEYFRYDKENPHYIPLSRSFTV